MIEDDWPRMTIDMTGWIAECPSWQKVRAKEPDMVAIGSVCIFEELSVDNIGPFPTDELNNSYKIILLSSI